MDRREFFKLAGVGAGALIVAPQFVLAEPTVPKKIPVEPPAIKREVGHIYKGNTQICAIANCTIEMHAPMINVSTRETMLYVDYWPGKPEVSIYGDMFPLTGMTESEIMDDPELYRIILSFPDGMTVIDAEGMITSIGISVNMNEESIRSFEFRVQGAATITCN